MTGPDDFPTALAEADHAERLNWRALLAVAVVSWAVVILGGAALWWWAL